MAISFPANPNENDSFTSNGKTWVWSGGRWKIVGASNRGLSLEISDAAPSNPVQGDMWYESDSGRTYTYYDNVWIELGNTSAVYSFIADDDTDTLIQVEESADEDVIRFDVGGVEKAVLDSSGLSITGDIEVSGSYVGLSSDSVRDADNDTKVEVEVTADSDAIRFTTASTPRFEVTSAGHIVPFEDVTYDLGSSSYRFRDLYLSGNTIDLGGATISYDGSNLRMGSMEVDTSGSAGVVVASGTTAQRPSSPKNGTIRFNTDNLNYEGYANGSWYDITTSFNVAGGTIYTVAGYKYHVFTSSGSLVVNGSKPADILVVGGGGGGGSWVGGGAGAGGVVKDSVQLSEGTYTIIVGAGGVGSLNPGGYSGMPNGSKGGDSSISFPGFTTALGGGMGASHTQNNTSAWMDGGSGGGNSGPTHAVQGQGTAGQGNNGGIGYNTGPWACGGGGGAGAAGSDYVDANTAGDGGVGVYYVEFDNWGENGYYGGGGGGGKHDAGGSAGSGGLGGGADGSVATTVKAASGMVNTGGGGGGSGNGGSSRSEGGNGGSGIVIVRYQI